MAYSISVTAGTGDLKHNRRDKKSGPHIDKSRTPENLTLIDRDIEKVYHELFDEALAKHNAKTKKPTITDYYRHVCNSKKLHPFKEVIIQVGSMDHHPDKELVNEIYMDYLDKFHERFPQFEIIGAYIHNDEATPHMHIDFIPVAEKNTKVGLEKRVSFETSYKEMGYETFVHWQHKCLEDLEKTINEHGLEREVIYDKSKHMNIHFFKQKAKEYEVELEYYDKLLNEKKLQYEKLSSNKEIEKMVRDAREFVLSRKFFSLQDKENYVKLMKNLEAAIGHALGHDEKTAVKEERELSK